MDGQGQVDRATQLTGGYRSGCPRGGPPLWETCDRPARSAESAACSQPAMSKTALPMTVRMLGFKMAFLIHLVCLFAHSKHQSGPTKIPSTPMTDGRLRRSFAGNACRCLCGFSGGYNADAIPGHIEPITSFDEPAPYFDGGRSGRVAVDGRPDGFKPAFFFDHDTGCSRLHGEGNQMASASGGPASWRPDGVLALVDIRRRNAVSVRCLFAAERASAMQPIGTAAVVHHRRPMGDF